MKMQRVSRTRIGPLTLIAFMMLWWVGCSDVAGPRWVQTVKTAPGSVTLEPGETAVFDVKVLDQNGDDLPEWWAPKVKWSIYNPSVATFQTLDVGVSVTALQPGTAWVRAELGRGRYDAPVYVQPPGLDRIEIEPSPLTESLVSRRVVAYARLFDASGAEMDPTGFRLSWEVADTTIAFISNWRPFEFAVVHGRQAGQTRLRLTVGDTTVSTDVFVIREPLAPLAPSVTTVSSDSLEVIWASDAGGAGDGYRVYRSASFGGTYTHIASPGQGKKYFASADTTYVDVGLSPSTTYFYQVEACHKEEGCSERSPPGSGTTASEG